MELVITVAVLAGIVTFLATGGIGMLRRRALFILEIQSDGRVRTVSGTPPPAYPGACEDVARLNGLRAGRIWAVRAGRSMSLKFSRDIPEPARQALRNTWTPPPPRGGGGGTRATG